MKFQFSIRALMVFTMVVAVYCYVAVKCVQEVGQQIPTTTYLLAHGLTIGVTTAAFTLLYCNGKRYFRKTIIFSEILTFLPAGTILLAQMYFSTIPVFIGVWFIALLFVHILAISSSIVSTWNGWNGQLGFWVSAGLSLGLLIYFLVAFYFFLLTGPV